MNINPVSFSFCTQTKLPKLNFSKPQQSGFLKNSLMSDTFVKSSPAISFTSVDDGPDGDAIRTLGDMPCPCCGHKMVRGSEMDKMFRQNKKILGGPSSKAVALLSPYEECLHPTEKACFELIKNGSKKEPQKNIQQLLVSARPDYFNDLKKVETKVFDKILSISKQLPEDDNIKIQKLIKTSKKMIDKEPEKNGFKRKNFISSMEDITRNMEDEKVAKALRNTAKKLPTSSDSVSAFVIKYTQPNPKTQQPRTCEEIIRRLLIPSVATIEHIKPRSDGGENRVSNYLLECAEDNNTRMSQSFNEFVAEHPQMQENAQRYMDIVIDKINKKQAMKGFRAYPVEVAKTLEYQSKGTLILDTSRLKLTPEQIQKEVDNREIRYAKEAEEKRLKEEENKKD